MIDIKTAIKQAESLLNHSSESPRIDAEILLAHVLIKSRTFLYTHPETLLSNPQWKTYLQLLKMRETGVPVAYLTGIREFWSMPLQVSEDTLIPRPETEQLVELTLKILSGKPQARILDLGTGSGAIALALASERPTWDICACDNSKSALHIAETNAMRLGLNIHFYHSDWFASLPNEAFDLIVSNPPYISANDPHLTQGDIRFEPPQALVSGVDGLVALYEIIEKSREYLLSNGWLLLEHGFDQKQDVMNKFKQCGYQKIQSWQDSQAHPRICSGQYTR